MKLVFKYRRERARRRTVYRPVAKLSLRSADGYWYTFIAYVDSGADLSLLTGGRFGVNLCRGGLLEPTGVGGRLSQRTCTECGSRSARWSSRRASLSPT